MDTMVTAGRLCVYLCTMVVLVRVSVSFLQHFGVSVSFLPQFYVPFWHTLYARKIALKTALLLCVDVYLIT